MDLAVIAAAVAAQVAAEAVRAAAAEVVATNSNFCSVHLLA